MSGPFRSVTTVMADWPQIEGVLRELGQFAECSMCDKDVRLGLKDQPEWTTVRYGGKPVCIDHARDLKELTRNKRYADAAMETLGRLAHEEREEESGDAETDDPCGT